MKVIINNIATEYLDEGSGPAVLMLHGWLDNHQSFDQLSSGLSKNHRVVRLDLPGFGKTEVPTNDWHLADYVDFVAEFVSKLNLKDYVLIGHSFGGRIAIKACATQKLTPSSLILIDSAGVARRPGIRAVAFTAIAKIGKVVTLVPPLYFWRKQLRSALYRLAKSDYIASEYIGQTFKNVVTEDLSEQAKLIKMPTLLIWGAIDQITPIQEGKRLNQLIPQSKLIVIQGAGHFAHHDKPQETLAAVEQFL